MALGAPEGPLAEGEHRLALAGQRLAELARGRVQRFGRDHAVHEPPGEGVFGRQARPGEDELQRPLSSQVPLQPSEHHHRKEADVHLRGAELGVLGGHGQVARTHQAQPSAEGVPVELGQRGLGKCGQLLEEKAVGAPRLVPGEEAVLSHPAQVPAGREDAGAGAGEHHHPDRRVGAGPLKAQGEGCHHFRGERVAGLGAVDG